MTQAVILAGGKGTRLASVSGGLPKPLVNVAGVPVVERQIELLIRYGIDEIFLTTGHGADVFLRQFDQLAKRVQRYDCSCGIARAAQVQELALLPLLMCD